MPTSLVFTGHMVDLPGRPEPRFPPSLEKAVESRIARALERFAPGSEGDNDARGFASAARGGDILFHEQCRRLGIPTAILLPFAPDDFVAASVGGDWTERFWSLWNATPAADRETMNLPVADAGAYGECNIRILERARAYGRLHLIALWDGKSGDGPGGAQDMVNRAGAWDAPDVFSPASVSAPER
jgi:hypothetical protein